MFTPVFFGHMCHVNYVIIHECFFLSKGTVFRKDLFSCLRAIYGEVVGNMTVPIPHARKKGAGFITPFFTDTIESLETVTRRYTFH